MNISIDKKVIQDKYHTIIKNSEEEENFISDLIKAVGDIDTTMILDKNSLELII